MNFHLLPPEASTIARESDWMFWALTVLSLFICALVFLPLCWFAVKYRRGRKVDRKISEEVATWKVEVTWTVIPLLITLALFTWSADAFFRMETPPEGAIEINVVGKQWMWKLQHAEGAREINELHIPRGKPVKLTMISQDVIHDFFVPSRRTRRAAIISSARSIAARLTRQ